MTMILAGKDLEQVQADERYYCTACLKCSPNPGSCTRCDAKKPLVDLADERVIKALRDEDLHRARMYQANLTFLGMMISLPLFFIFSSMLGMFLVACSGIGIATIIQHFRPFRRKQPAIPRALKDRLPRSKYGLPPQ